MNDEMIQNMKNEWKNTTVIACIVAGIDFAIISFGFLLNHSMEFTIWTVASIGIITFFGMLIISSHHAKYSADSKGIMRKSLTASLISLYVVILALIISGALNGMQDEMVKSALSNFSVVVIAIIGFYFGAKGISEVVRLKT